MAEYKTGPRQDFALFKNKYAKTDRHPSEVGNIEIEREFLKDMVEQAKTGVMPTLKAASWNRTSKKGVAYQFVRLEVAMPQEDSPIIPNEAEESGAAEQDDGDDDMPW